MFYIRLKGGLGNQMFQYVFGEALSNKTGKEVKYDTRFLEDIESSKYNSFRSFAKRPLVLSHFPNIDKNKFISLPTYALHSGILGRIYDKVLTKINKRFVQEKHFQHDNYETYVKDDAYFDGNWQSYKYFNQIEERIRHDFDLSSYLNSPSNESRTDSGNEGSEQSKKICIHIRRGDMANDPRTRAFHGVVSVTYVKEAVKKMYEILASTISTASSPTEWMIYSDDIPWCEENLNRNNIGINQKDILSFYNPNLKTDQAKVINPSIVQMADMTEADHFILSNSTYGWWASFLSQKNLNKTVICPKEFYKASGFSSIDLIPPTWVTIDIPLE